MMRSEKILNLIPDPDLTYCIALYEYGRTVCLRLHHDNQLRGSVSVKSLTTNEGGFKCGTRPQSAVLNTGVLPLGQMLGVTR
jgi:hypothetical protein